MEESYLVEHLKAMIEKEAQSRYPTDSDFYTRGRIYAEVCEELVSFLKKTTFGPKEQSS